MSCGCAGPQQLNTFGCCCRCGQLPAVREEGPPGAMGPAGVTPSFIVGSVTDGPVPSVVITEITPGLWQLDFVLPGAPTSTENTWSETQTFLAEAIFDDGLTSDGPVQINDDLAVTGNAVFQTVQVLGDIQSNGTAEFSSLTVFNDASIGGNLFVAGGLTAMLAVNFNGGVNGITNGSAAGVGKVGEILFSEVLSGSAIPLTTDTPQTVTSIALTAGQWNVFGVVYYTGLAGITTIDNLGAGISVVDNSFWAFGQGVLVPGGGAPITPDLGVSSPPVTVNQPGGLLHFLIAQAGFGVSTLSAYGRLWAIRVR